MQQNPFPSRKLPDYREVFNQQIVPDVAGHHPITGHNIKFTQNLERVSTDLLFIDSAFRNWDVEEPNKYTIRLNDKFQYVHSLELVEGTIPSSGYVVDRTNNKFYFQETQAQVESQTYYTVTVPIGNYQIDELLNTLKVEMEAVGSSQYTLTVNNRTKRVTIATNDSVGTGIFNLVFTEQFEIIGPKGQVETLEIDPVTNKKVSVYKESAQKRHQYITYSIGRILGFSARNRFDALSYTGDMNYTLCPHDYLAIHLTNQLDDNFQKIYSPNDNLQGAFAIVWLNQITSEFELQQPKVIDNVRYLRTFNPPIDITALKVEFRTREGHLYDFNGQENSLLFELKRVYDREVIDRLNQLN